MVKRAGRVAAVTAATVGVMVLLAGCFFTQSGSLPPSATNPPTDQSSPSTSPSSAPSTAPSVSPSATPTVKPVAKGCPATTDTTPAGAKTRKTIDVDGDGKADTEWISGTPSLRFGVTTASGATYSYGLNTASPNTREGLIARLNDHRIVSLADDGRSAYVHFFVKCAWVQTKDSHGIPYTYDMNNFHGNGTGVGCSLGYVVGWNLVATGTTYTVKKTLLYLNVDGGIASNGPTSVVVKNAPATDARVKTAQTMSCATVTVANGGVTLDG